MKLLGESEPVVVSTHIFLGDRNMGIKTNYVGDDTGVAIVPTYPTDPKVGDACTIGRIPGVVVEPKDKEGNYWVRLRGIFRLVTTGETSGGPAAISAGDKLWLGASQTNPLSMNDGSGAIPFGYALEPVSAGDSKKIRVFIYSCPDGAVIAVMPPEAPAPTETSKTATQVVIGWVAPAEVGDGVTGYDVRWRTGGATPGPWNYPDALQGLAATVLSATISGLATATEYQFSVRAKTIGDNGPWSEALEVTTS